MVREDRRKLPRYYAPKSFTATGVFPPKREHLLQVRDIGIGSIRFDTDLDLSREAIFSLSFEIPDKKGEPIRIHTLASILWFVNERQPPLYTAGAQFLGLTKADQEALQEFLETLELIDRV